MTDQCNFLAEENEKCLHINSTFSNLRSHSSQEEVVGSTRCMESYVYGKLGVWKARYKSTFRLICLCTRVCMRMRV